MSSGFVTETELAEARRLRQEQWQSVRTADQPDEAPEEPYDPRPLYQRLEEQKNKKDADYEEAHKLKNMIRGLDDDEVGFLELVEQSKASVARQISMEEQREMKEFRERVSTVQDSVERERLQQISGVRTSAPKKSNANNTRNMLQGVIIRKRKVSDTDTEKTDEPAPKISAPTSNGNGDHSSNGHSPKRETPNNDNIAEPLIVNSPPKFGGMQCVGILPGIGPYGGSSDSDCSSDSDDDNQSCVYDLVGRKLECKGSKAGKTN